MKKNLRFTSIFFLIMIALSFSSCLTHYQWNLSFYRNYESGNFEAAKSALEKDKDGAKRKTKLLYFLNLGIVNALLDEFETSNQYFEKAYILSEDYQKNYLNEILAYFTNPMIVEYKGEDFEILLIYYYKALNFLRLGNKEAALVECKRMNIKLNQMAERYKNDNKYQRDAFIHTLMGIIYEANDDINNAFIAYRNAVEIYEEDYKKIFSLNVPEQLKWDVMRTAQLMGFDSELARFEKKFGLKYTPEGKRGGNLVFLWHNGLGPVKTQWAINFGIVRQNREWVTFENKDLGLSFPFKIEMHKNREGKEVHPLRDMETYRVAFPKYVQRPRLYHSAELQWQNETYPLYLAQDVNAVAVKTLEQKMLWIFGKSLLRLAIKKAEVEALKKEQKDGLARIINLINTSTEQADTRGWMAVPHSIYYVRVPLPAGKHPLKLITKSAGKSTSIDFEFDIQKGSTVFHTFHSFETVQGFQNFGAGW